MILDSAGSLFVVRREFLSYQVACRYNHLIVYVTPGDLSVTQTDQ